MDLSNFLDFIIFMKNTDHNNSSFGRRLAELRKKAGYSQRSFAEAIGISYRMVAYYEVQTDKPPARILPVIAKTLDLSIDELLGLKTIKGSKRLVNKRILNKLKQIEKLPRRQQKAVIEHIDALVAQTEKQEKE